MAPEIRTGRVLLNPVLARIIATGAGTGNMPFAPGTFGSLAAFPIAWLSYLTGGFALFLAVLALLLIVAWPAIRSYNLIHGEADHKSIVIDEICGQLIALIPIYGLYWAIEDPDLVSPPLVGWALAFCLFRLLDILKPWPISALDRLPGARGIMLDDIMAGILSAGGLLLLMYIAIAAHSGPLGQG